MTDIMKLADDYADTPVNMYELDPEKDRKDARAALQSAIEALQAENSQLRTDLNAELQGNAAMRMRLGAKDGETMLAFAERLAFQLDAMGKGEPVQFLCDATRFKVRRHEGDEASQIFGLPRELNGRWVALVAADDDCHLKLAAPKALAPLTDEQVYFGQWDDGSGSSADFREGARFAERHHGIGGTP